MSKLEEIIERLIEEIRILKSENEALRLENAELKEKLGLTSKNSSLPSSKELYKLKRNKPKSDRKAGGQVGHNGVRRQKMLADKIIQVPLAVQCGCGGEIALSKTDYVHQKVDLPEIKPYVVEYHLQHGRCRRCGRRKASRLPEGVAADTFGSNVKSVIAALTGFYKNSKQEVANILKDIFNLDISVGSISNSENRVSAKCKDYYYAIEQEVVKSKIIHIDETSHYNKGKLGWCWMFTSQVGSLLKLTNSRGKKVLETSSFSSSDNIYVTDRYAAYNYFAKENRQICWAHLARDFERFAHSQHIEVKKLGCYLRQVASELFALQKALSNNEIAMLRFLRRTRKLRKRTWYYLKNITCISNAVHAVRVAKNIIKVENMMWKFLDDPMNIPLTNNHAERQIRHYVVYRKNSYFTQSERGNIFLERIISLYLTCKQQQLNPFQNLLSLVS
ncbi:IS66 family transposase [Rickettsia endosymbiont of Polydrusus tereticollis]|uniref:IS66 family transposase n=1 Tax=Rickettsia endosymbiont of Polydrusus tereticollis TaxID=3066251 RepID=UPI003132BBD4